MPNLVLICYLRVPFVGLETKHVTLYLFPVLVYKCLVNNTALSDFQYCIHLMLKNQVNIKTHPKILGTSMTVVTLQPLKFITVS